MDKGSRMVFGEQTAALFLRTADKVTVLLGHGNVPLTVLNGRALALTGSVTMVNTVINVTAL